MEKYRHLEELREALGSYFRAKNSGENASPFEEDVIKYAKEYARVCKEEIAGGKL